MAGEEGGGDEGEGGLQAAGPLHRALLGPQSGG